MKSKLPLPHPNNLLTRTKSLAMLDAIYCQQWDLRYFSHNSKWGEKEEMSSMRDGEGDDYFILFSPEGVVMKGCFLEGGLSGEKNLLNEIHALTPYRFSNFLDEAAFSINEASFVSWFDEQVNEWIKIGMKNDDSGQDDGSDYLIGWIIGDHNFYWKWASDYYERTIDINLVEHVFNFLPLDVDYVKRLDVNLDENKLFEDINEIGYPYR